MPIEVLSQMSAADASDAQNSPDYETALVRNAVISDADLTPGVDPLPSGTLYFVYE